MQLGQGASCTPGGGGGMGHQRALHAAAERCRWVRFKRSGPPAGTNDTSDGRRPACAREGEVVMHIVDQMGAAGEAHAGFGGRVGRGTQGTEEGLL